MRTTTSLFLAAAIGLAATPAQAEESLFGHTLELGIFGGALFFPDNEHELLGSNSSWKPLRETNIELGARLAYLPIDYVGIEGEIPLVGTGTVDRENSARIYIPRGHLLVQYPAKI
ncbi:MAG: hypothetical protein AAFQ82_24955, partial [Myxococcota bacterium]